MERCRFEVPFHGYVVGTLLRVCERVACDVLVPKCRDVEMSMNGCLGDSLNVILGWR